MPTLTGQGRCEHISALLFRTDCGRQVSHWSSKTSNSCRPALIKCYQSGQVCLRQRLDLHVLCRFNLLPYSKGHRLLLGPRWCRCSRLCSVLVAGLRFFHRDPTNQCRLRSPVFDIFLLRSNAGRVMSDLDGWMFLMNWAVVRSSSLADPSPQLVPEVSPRWPQVCSFECVTWTVSQGVFWVFDIIM